MGFVICLFVGMLPALPVAGLCRMASGGNGGCDA